MDRHCLLAGTDQAPGCFGSQSAEEHVLIIHGMPSQPP
jgi:hypothetical protein